ncbi:TIGR01777 family oxidoreductase [Bacteriovoracaceae bacterium]|nr:TIGR01777 family oxidoreductase [Bacteriovoracaceae bacterium]
MNILITGGTGFVGSQLVSLLKEKQGHKLFVITRNPNKYKSAETDHLKYISLDQEGLLSDEIVKDIHIIINLAGENIANSRWSDAQKERLKESRSTRTNLLLAQFKDSEKLKKIISASAIGIYPVNLETELDESSNLGEGFLPELCKEWEKSVTDFDHSCKKAILRIGVVFGKGGGALDKLWPIFKFGLGGKIGNGKQMMSWIHISDLVGAIDFLVDNIEINGEFNATSPEPVSNQRFTKALGKAFNMPAIFPVPPFMLKLAMGEMSTIVLDGQTIIPKKLLAAGYQFKFAQVENALEDVVNS